LVTGFFSASTGSGKEPPYRERMFGFLG